MLAKLKLQVKELEEEIKELQVIMIDSGAVTPGFKMKTPSGTEIMVVRDDPYITAKDGQQRELSLHHNCHVWVTEGSQSC